MAHILGLGGSLREGSRTLQALRIALQGAAEAGAEVRLLDLKGLALPLYDDRSDPSSYPDDVSRLIEEVRWADGLLLATPVYHGILSGAMKNALDFLELLSNDDPPWLEGRVVGLIAVAGGSSGENAINSMLFACRTLKGWVLPTAAVVPGGAFDSEERLSDPRIAERLRRLGREVAEHAGLLAPARLRRRG
jgi:FMN reductase